MNKLSYILLILSTSSCTTLSDNSLLEARLNQIELQQARQYYLIRCDLCDLYAKPGTPMNQKCIINETKKWNEIKRRRGWK